ncbi:MAG: DegT/DnrJ/EryC1/StrS family aminotransferase [Victivallales bacterium]|jgi:dTDP-4-amino-4,6-dideoxygalactose transaminase|nr:DegT/DnrJ/EryC1/StrS family aminotransferase [Victivallales bacterium]
MNDPIYVTKPSLPNLEEFIPSLEKIWANKQLTNNGEFHKEFERHLADYLGVKFVSLFTNGMLALQVGMQALRITGEVITTPFTFVATPHAIHWNGCTPVFCDIEPESFTLDPAKVESLITPKTTAIMPVHVYGNPCQDKELRRIADTYGLKLFYDAAHAFGVRQHGVSICNYGDLSMLSFHATKTFNTFEGGALVTNDEAMKKRIDFLKNFGFANEVTVVAPGSNGKMDEFRAAFGLLQLKHINEEIAKRQKVAQRYREMLKDIPGIRIFRDIPGVQHNYSYFPVTVDERVYGISRDALYEKLKKENIFSRRYFYPLCSDFPSYRGLPSAAPANLPVAAKVAQEILCLPIYADLTCEEQDSVVKLVTS